MLSVPLNNKNALLRSSKSKNEDLFTSKLKFRCVRNKPFKVVNSNMPPYELLSHGIVYFTIFYCTINWNYYRNIRLKAERKINLKDKSKKNNK